MADRVHTAVNTLQPSATNSPLDATLPHAGGKQLRAGHHSMLPLGQHGDRRITERVQKSFTTNDFCTHPPNRAARGSRRGRNRHFLHSSMTKLT
jgi:hypothetical protein